jgi:hypothetical protein
MTRKLLIPIFCLALAFMACSKTVSIPGFSLKTEPTTENSASPTLELTATEPLQPVQPQSSTTPQASETPTPQKTSAVVPSPSISPTFGPTLTLGPDDWKKMPVIPTGISKQVKLIYQLGLLKGNNPRAYSKVGDCNIILPYFIGAFDNPGAYNLGEYSSLQDTINYFAGSHNRRSAAAKQGMTAYSVLTMLWVDQSECQASETPLTCELRENRPMFVILSFGTNDAYSQVNFEKAVRRVIELSIGNGTVPILATKADNSEHDNSINRKIASLAYEYQLPLWNFWAAVQPLPYHGMSVQFLEHLSAGVSEDANFNFTGENLQYGWTIRNLSALQMLDAMRKAVEIESK